VVKPTFTQEGYTAYTCSRCGDYYETNRTPMRVLEYSPTLSLRYHQATSVFSDVARNAPDLTWNSSNTKVLKIDQNGLVTYAKRGRGETTVTASDADGIVRMSVKVTVKYAWWQWLIFIFLFGWIWY
jgi:uncharacterized protein YjdB